MTDQAPAADLLRGAVDVHVHATPHINARRVDAITAAEMAIDAGMRAIVLIDNFAPSSGLAELVGRRVEAEEPFAVLGGIVLNHQVGLINPDAVETALAYGDGAAFVSLPTHHTRHVALAEGRDRAEVERAFAVPERVDGALAATLDLVADAGVVFNAGHVAPDEAVRVVEAARARGIERIIVPAQDRPEATAQELADLGALLEYTFFFVSHASEVALTHIDATPTVIGHHPAGSFAAAIRAVGVEHCIVSSDAGSSLLPPPVEALRSWLATLAALGFSADELTTMVATNPLRLFSHRLDSG